MRVRWPCTHHAHVDLALELHQRRRRRQCHAVLPGTRLGDELGSKLVFVETVVLRCSTNWYRTSSTVLVETVVLQ